ncbi:GNAT family N-acetyltransferase [Cognatishimia sp. SS12]|uniref:GNAT family N-acetyltransferase n=1 Tax=Cognatishimia sp. SS12 TaxID=2979465 RepID=UPI002330F242|nr:GNAT family N-acetyltransferase [Cognatishimia sp. SS12]MDC0737623.1 GNAT family N-acetyltransferase [Cognatishimia sp. SS12]
MTWQIFVTDDIETCLALRRVVFIEEQNVPEAEEIDDLDDQAIHLLATVDGSPKATARLFVKGDTGKIGRVCVVKSARGTGLGVAIMQYAMDHLKTQPGVKRLMLSAQEQAMGFYERLGFVAYGDSYDDAGIPHRDMEVQL